MGFDTTTLLLMFLLGPAVFIIGWFRPFAVLSALVLLLPFRDLSIRVLNAFTDIPIDTVNSLSRWWFVIVLGLLAVWLVKGIRSALALRKIPRPGALDILLGALVVMGVIEALASPVRLAGITSLRGYLQPLIVFVLARSFKTKEDGHYRTLNIAFLVIGGLLFAMALWQSLTWTEPTYIKWGFVDQSGRTTALGLMLGDRFILRPPSTVSGPNELGLLFLILFFISLQWLLFGKRQERPIIAVLSFVFLSGLGLAFSRSAFIGFIAAVLIFLVLLMDASMLSFFKLGRRSQTTIILIVVIGVVVFISVLTSTGLFAYIGQTIRSLSSEGHIVESIDAIRFLAQHPEGVGMGMVWPKGAAVLRETEALYHVEGSLFQIGVEWSVLGLAIWSAFIGSSLFGVWKTWKGSNHQNYRITAGAGLFGWIGALVAFIFLPLMQSINLMVLLWFLMGLGVGAAKVGGSRAVKGIANSKETTDYA